MCSLQIQIVKADPLRVLLWFIKKKELCCIQWTGLNRLRAVRNL